MTRNFISGVGGFVASHLVDYLLSKNESVYGSYRWNEDLSSTVGFEDNIQMIPMDLNDLSSCIRAIRESKPDYVFHLAAESFVPDSYIYPESYFRANTIGTYNLLEAIRIVGCDPIIHVCSCYDDKTEVLTKRGFLKYTEINKDDKVLSINLVTNIIEYKPIERIYIYYYNGEMKQVKSRSVDLLLTPNHKMLFSSCRNGTLGFKEIGEFKNKERCYFAKGKVSGKRLDKIKIDNRMVDFKDVLYLLGMYIGDGVSDKQSKNIINKTGLNRKDFLRICRNDKGKFVCTGNVGNKYYSVSNSYRVFLYVPKADKSYKRLVDCLERMGIKYHEFINGIYFTSKSIHLIFNKCGHDAYKKDIPNWVFQFDSDYLDNVYRGLIDSDGYYHKTGERFNTVSPLLRESFLKLCVMTGRFATYSKTNPKTNPIIRNRKIKTNGSYVFSITDKTRMIDATNISESYYNGIVWCLDIKDNHNMLVRRNNKTCFCGNSSEVYGLVTKDLIPIKETCPLNPSNPYAVSKVGADMMALMYWTNYGLKTIRTRMFTHSGYGRKMKSAEVSFARQVALIEKGLREPVLYHGNLNSVRTWADVKDAVKAYYLLVRKGEYGEVYNIGGDTTKTIGEMLDYMLSLSKVKIEKRLDPSLLRPYDVDLQIPDVSKFKQVTNWRPEIPFETTIQDVLRYWRERV